jgi:hypothetical protein
VLAVPLELPDSEIVVSDVVPSVNVVLRMLNT